MSRLHCFVLLLFLRLWLYVIIIIRSCWWLRWRVASPSCHLRQDVPLTVPASFHQLPPATCLFGLMLIWVSFFFFLLKAPFSFKLLTCVFFVFSVILIWSLLFSIVLFALFIFGFFLFNNLLLYGMSRFMSFWYEPSWVSPSLWPLWPVNCPLLFPFVVWTYSIASC